MNERVWHVKSQSGCNPEGYSVSLVTAVCSECSVQQDRHDLTICKAPECQFLCAHMYKCDDACYDFNNGHLCKHIHRVHSLECTHDSNQPTSPVEQQCDQSSTETNLSFAETFPGQQKGTVDF